MTARKKIGASLSSAGRADALQQAQTRLAELGRLLAQQQAEVLARLGAVEAELSQVGLATPEAIAQAFDAIDASDREGLMRQRVRPPIGPAPGPAPAPVRRRPRRMV